MDSIRIGTRGSSLALAQTAWVRQCLLERYPDLKVEVEVIKTSGDRFQTIPIENIGAKGVFIKEIEDALLDGAIDLAVHSMKDLPTEMDERLTLAAVPERVDSRDVLISHEAKGLSQLDAGARVGTGSLRRRAQILHRRPDLTVVPIRGNVDTRLTKLKEGVVNALILAYAGLQRIGRENEVTQLLPQEICTSAVAQGVLGLETRRDDTLQERLNFLHHEPTALEVDAERAFLRRLEGGCQLPVGGRATVLGNSVTLAGVVAEESGQRLFRGQITGTLSEAAALGVELAERLLGDGAAEVLRNLQQRGLR